MLKFAIPLLHISSASATEAFYCQGLGFRKAFCNFSFGDSGPCYMAVERDGVWLHFSSHAGDSVAGQAVNIFVEDVDALHAELVAKAVAIALPPTDQTWGNREMYVKDPDGNSLRFVRASHDVPG